MVGKNNPLVSLTVFVIGFLLRGETLLFNKKKKKAILMHEF